jgi:hypothetical protein
MEQVGRSAAVLHCLGFPKVCSVSRRWCAIVSFGLLPTVVQLARITAWGVFKIVVGKVISIEPF